jgi:hypothetical protein
MKNPMAAVTPVIANPKGLVSLNNVENPLIRDQIALAIPPRFPAKPLLASRQTVKWTNWCF